MQTVSAPFNIDSQESLLEFLPLHRTHKTKRTLLFFTPTLLFPKKRSSHTYLHLFSKVEESIGVNTADNRQRNRCVEVLWRHLSVYGLFISLVLARLLFVSAEIHLVSGDRNTDPTMEVRIFSLQDPLFGGFIALLAELFLTKMIFL